MLLRLVEEKMDDNTLNLSMLADYAHVSESTASRLIKNETGLNLQEYPRKRRIETAKELLLHTAYPITKIAEEVGFNSCSYFIRVFKAEEGQTPVAFRAANTLDTSAE